MELINRFIIGNSILRYTNIWFWYRLINHRYFRMDDHIRYNDFWDNINRGYYDMKSEYYIRNRNINTWDNCYE